MAGSGHVVAVDAFRHVHPREFFRKFLQHEVRPDGRGLTRIRKTTIVTGSVSTAHGSALVRCGQTAVLCGIKAEIAEPTVARPQHGFMVTNIDLSPMCSSKFRPGPPSDQAQVLSQRLQDTLVGSSKGPWAIDLTELCIAEGKSAWVLFADIICLNYDGSVFDAALVAVCAALRNLRLPEATYDADKRQVFVAPERTRALTLPHVPVATTFGVFDGSVFADPSDQEETIAETLVTIVCNSEEKIVGVTQLGTAPLPANALSQCMIVAMTRAKEITNLIAEST